MSGPITSTTAPGKVFESRIELANHYKSDWHKYNLKRKEAGLPLLEHSDFQARWEAALALRKEKQALEQGSHKKRHGGSSNGGGGKDHLKQKNNKKKQQLPQQSNNKNEEDDGTTTTNEGGEGVGVGIETSTTIKLHPKETAESQENPEINPLQCLFDSHISNSLQENVEYMQQQYGFFLPDQEHLIDLEGLLGYCQEKIKLGHYCLYCEKMSKTWQGCQKHMLSKEHTKLRYEIGYWDDLDVFYDFQETKEEEEEEGDGDQDMVDAANTAEGEQEDGGWEDMSEGDNNIEGKDDDDEDTLFGGYEREIARFGLSVTVLGELVFPDGRIIGHRGLQRYYKQRPRPVSQSTAFLAAQEAAGERLYEGRVVNIQKLPGGSSINNLPGAGKGILVPTKSPDGKEGTIMSFSAMSLYRYRAVVRKQRREDDQGKRLQFKTKMNMNQMGKKANMLMNGISIQHCGR